MRDRTSCAVWTVVLSAFLMPRPAWAGLIIGEHDNGKHRGNAEILAQLPYDGEHDRGLHLGQFKNGYKDEGPNLQDPAVPDLLPPDPTDETPDVGTGIGVIDPVGDQAGSLPASEGLPLIPPDAGVPSIPPVADGGAGLTPISPDMGGTLITRDPGLGTLAADIGPSTVANPEPSSLVTGGLGVLLLLGYTRRRRATA